MHITGTGVPDLHVHTVAITADDPEACSAEVDRHRAGEDHAGTLVRCPAPDLPPGEYWVGVIVDADDVRAESDEHNNVAVADVPVPVVAVDSTTGRCAARG